MQHCNERHAALQRAVCRIATSSMQQCKAQYAALQRAVAYAAWQRAALQRAYIYIGMYTYVCIYIGLP